VFDIAFHVYELVRDSRKFLKEASQSLGRMGSDRTARLIRVYRRIVRVAIGVVTIGWVVPPCISPWLAVWLHGIAPADALFRMFLGLLISIGLLPFYIITGAALGCLTAPAAFLTAPSGKTWMKLLGGTRSVLKHRVFCVLATLTGFGLMVGMGVFLFSMSPTIR
jgi:hypothetical protein